MFTTRRKVTTVIATSLGVYFVVVFLFGSMNFSKVKADANSSSFTKIIVTVSATENGNGAIMLNAVPTVPAGVPKDTLDSIQYYVWDFYTPPVNQGDPWTKILAAKYSAKPELKISFSKPDVYYVEVHAYSYSDKKTSVAIKDFSRIIVGIQPESGDSLIINNNFVTDPAKQKFISSNHIPGDMDFPLVKTSITFFSDGSLYLPLFDGNESSIGINPDIIQIDLPLDISLQTNSTTRYTILSQNDPTVPIGYHRYELKKTKTVTDWSNRNWTLLLFPHFNSSSVIGQKNLQMRIRAMKGDTQKILDTQISRTDNWQTISISCEAIPDIQLPKRLTTSFTWTYPDQFVINNNLYPSDSNFFSIYKKLGFNSVPYFPNGKDSTTDPFLVNAANRQNNPEWQGLTFGPEYSALYGYTNTSGTINERGYFNVINLDKLNVILKTKKLSLLATNSDIDTFVNSLTTTSFKSIFGFDISDKDLGTEKPKLGNALKFYLSHKFLDMAYDGIFLTNDLKHFSNAVSTTKPEYVFVDSENWGETYSQWAGAVVDSKNAQNQKGSGETDAQLAYRITDQFLNTYTSAVSKVSPKTKFSLHAVSAVDNEMYGPFPRDVLQKYNVVFAPQFYTISSNPEVVAMMVRLNRQNLPDKYPLVPWLTTGTYGELDSSIIFDQVIHTFLNGATGFSVFANFYDDDMADVLNMTKAIGLISPHEDIVMDGQVAYGDISSINNAVVSAMKLNGEYLIGVTPKDKTQPVSFTINTSVNNKYTLTDLRHNKNYSYANGVISFSGILSESTVMDLIPDTSYTDLKITSDKKYVVAGGNVNYDIAYKNTKGYAIANASITVPSDSNFEFVSAADGGKYDATSKLITWAVPSIGKGVTFKTSFVFKVK